MKIIDKIRSENPKRSHFFSFEFFPPKTPEGLKNLYARFDRMIDLDPLFIDVTWGAGGTTSDETLDIALSAQTYFGIDVMMHLTCTNMPREKIDAALATCLDGGVRNILALRGDPPRGAQTWEQTANGFAYASDLTAYIRDKYQDHFGIGVGGYPEGHPEASSRRQDIQNLKLKCDQGADFVITQLFYDIETYKDFVRQCRAAGITCPIIPGILPIISYDRFQRFISFCGTKVPPQVMRDLEERKHNDAKIRSYGIDLCTRMCQELMEFGTPGFHFYTLNLESSVNQILRNLGLITDSQSSRELPWRPSTLPGRRDEAVRPIFWSNRPKSYTARTLGWDDFPNGRWGDSRSPTFGDLREYYLIRQGLGLRQEQQKIQDQLGEPASANDLKHIFANYCRGKVANLPWSEGPLKTETNQISNELVALNEAGFLTINSQPQINGASSSDPDVGWGDPGGYVYQKAYVEFFVPPNLLEPLLRHVKSFPSLSFQAVNIQGTHYSNTSHSKPNAVTWGVFPGKEIIQPTIVDPLSFKIWKDEAFDLWLTDWAYRYPIGHHSRTFLEEVHNTYFLVNLVENDYIGGDIFKAFKPFLTEVEVEPAATIGGPASAIDKQPSP